MFSVYDATIYSILEWPMLIWKRMLEASYVKYHVNNKNIFLSCQLFENKDWT